MSCRNQVCVPVIFRPVSVPSPSGGGGGAPRFRSFLASGTFTFPSDTTRFITRMWGPGGNGGVEQKGTNAFGGGGGGAYIEASIDIPAGTMVTFTVNSGGDTILNVPIIGVFIAGMGSAGTITIASPGTGPGGAGGVATGPAAFTTALAINGQDGEDSQLGSIGGVQYAQTGAGGGSSQGGNGGYSTFLVTGGPSIIAKNAVTPGGGASGGGNINGNPSVQPVVAGEGLIEFYF